MGRYRLEEAIGSGAFGTVWRAVDERLDREVAVKAIPSELAGERAEREIKAAARLAHPGVVTLHEAAADSTHTYIVSEFVRGATLAQLFADGECSDRDVARIGAALAGAIDHAHGHGVVHRDVKPGNILIPDAPRSEAGIVKLADFGIALLAGESSLTRTGDIVGTLAYMAPEQAAGRAAGPEADLWALALIVYEGFAGQNPIRGATPAETARNLGEGSPCSLSEERADLPAELIEAVDDALEEDPRDRGSLADLGRALSACVAELDDGPGSIAPAVRRRSRSKTSIRISRRQTNHPVERQEDGLAPQTLARSRIDSEQPARITDSSPISAPGSWWRDRLMAAVAAAALTFGWSAVLAPTEIASQKWILAAGAGLLVGLLPRLGWLMAALASVVCLAVTGESGTAVVLSVALLPSPILLWRSPEWWSATWLAPLLGVPGFAGGWPAVASFGRTIPARAAAGAIGAWQIGCAELLVGRSLLSDGPGAGSEALWRDNPQLAFDDAVIPLVSGSTLAVAGVWAVAAVVLPLIVRGRSAVIDALAAAGWALATGFATAAVSGGVARGALAGALAGAALVVATRGWRGNSEMARGYSGETS